MKLRDPIVTLLSGALALAAARVALAPSSAAAQTDAKPLVVQGGDDSLPEKPPMVLQNRFFLKTLRPEVSVFGGQLLNESYSRTWMFGARTGLFLTEAIGAEYSFETYQPSDSDDLKALRSLRYCNDAGTKCTRPEPSFVRLERAHMATATFAPIYGKVNLLDWFILYSDIYANVGAGLLDTSQGSKIAGVIGFGQRLYFAKSYNVRIDAVDHIFQEERENLGTKKESVRNAWTVSLGVSAFLWE